MQSKLNIMILPFIAAIFIFSGCSGGGSSDNVAASSSLSGVAQKGAFLKDSNVSLCKLDEKMVCTADILEAKVSDDKGSYEFKTLPWSGLSRLTISGYYLDELTGKTSTSPATITAIVDIKSNVKQKTNTNLLTDMRAKRMRELVDNGKSVDEASEESKDDVKKLFNIKSDDFTALDLVDFSEGSASVNVELLRISAAVANAQDPVAVLEELMKIYSEYGIEAVLNSTLYKELMGLIEKVDVKNVLSQMTSPSEADAATIADLAPFAVANVITYGIVNADDKVRITLVGTEFIGEPSITVSSSNNLLGIDAISLSDDNRSVILDMNKSTSCEDVNLTFTVDYMTLKDLDSPIRTNQLRYRDENSLCATSSVDDDVNTTPVTIAPTAIISLVALEDNKIRLSLLGTEFENYTGTIDAELITSSDTLAIDETVVADNNKSVIFTLNEMTDYCAENNVTIGLYTFNLKDVANQSDTFKSNKIRYVSPNTIADCGNGNSEPVSSLNRAPTVSITPSAIVSVEVGTILELNATAVDANSEDTVTLLWRYKAVGSETFIEAGTTSEFTHTFDTLGRYIVEVTATDNHEASTQATLEFEVVAVNHAPVVSISPSEDKNINIGTSIVLESSASDEDGDDLSVSWKLKESGDTDYTTVANFGATGFNYTFNTIGTYLVVVEVEDGNGSKADANITVRVSEVPAVVVSLNDIETSVIVKGNDSFADQGQSGVAATLETAPLHGTVEFYLVGNESPYIRYTSTDCFIGSDSFIYKSGDDYGRVNVTITAPSTLDVANDVSVSIFNTEVISGNYLRANSASIGISITTPTTGGSSSLTVVGNEIVNYNYDPDDFFVGDDYFEYTLSETIDECSYTDIGRVDIEVKEPLPEVHLFSWYDDAHGYELWRTDGTVEGTEMVKDIRVGTDGSGAGAGIKIKDTNYFAANDGVHSTELWRSDGTESGTYMVKDINPGEGDTSYPYNLSVIGETMYFFGISGDNNGSNHIGVEGIWKSDGTSEGTLLVEDFEDYSLTSYGGPGYLKAFGNLLIFVMDDGAGNGLQWEPWISDGSSSAFKLKDIRPGDDGSSFMNCLELNNKCYASADDYYHGSELWVTDGTTSGTSMIKDIYEDDGSGRGEGGGASNLTVVGSQLFFISNSLSNGYALWKSDGTNATTAMVKDFFSDDDGTSYTHRYNYNYFTDVNGMLYFVFDDEVNGQELWKSDGTASGTVMVKDMGSDDYSAPSDLIEMNGTLYFWFHDNATPANSGLYKTDGTSNGTLLVKAISQDDYWVAGSGISKDNGKLYIELMHSSNANTYEYWISDGTEAGTFKLVDGESYGEGEF